MLTATLSVGTLSQVKVSDPSACAVHMIPAETYAACDVGAGATNTVLPAVTTPALTLWLLPPHPEADRVTVVVP